MYGHGGVEAGYIRMYGHSGEVGTGHVRMYGHGGEGE